MPYATYHEVVQAAALGDEEATAIMAEDLQALHENRGKQAAGEVLDKDFAQSAMKHALANGDMWNDPEAFARLVQVDSNLAEHRPDMSYDDRIAFAVAVVKEELGPLEERGYGEAIANMRAARTVAPKLRESIVHERVTATLDREDAEIEQSRSEQIQQMIEDRKPRPVPALLDHERP